MTLFLLKYKKIANIQEVTVIGHSNVQCPTRKQPENTPGGNTAAGERL